MKNTIFILQGFREEKEDGSLIDVVTFEVYAKTTEEALKKARKYLEKKYYRVTRIIEK